MQEVVRVVGTVFSCVLDNVCVLTYLCKLSWPEKVGYNLNKVMDKNIAILYDPKQPTGLEKVDSNSMHLNILS